MAGANRFLKSVVPEIKHSPAFKDGGLIAITFDQAPQTGPDADSSACCGPSSYPNLRKLTSPPAVPPAATGTAHDDDHLDEHHHHCGQHDDDRRVDHDRAGNHEPNFDHPTTTSTTSTTGSTSTTGPTSTTTPTSTTPASGLGSGETTPTGGGGQVGLLLISPYVKPNSIDVVDYFNHFSLLARDREAVRAAHASATRARPGSPCSASVCSTTGDLRTS